MGAREFINTFSLAPNLIYDVGIDQSTSCTGVGIQSINDEYITIMEIANEGLSKSFYLNALKTIFNKFIDVNIRYLVMEDPLNFMTKNQNSALISLKHALKDYFENSAFSYNKYDLIQPQSWRAGLIGKDNPHPKTSKEAAVYEILERYPELNVFKDITFHPTNNSGYDGFEALGLIIGYKERFSISNDSEIIKILGPKNTTKIGFGVFCYCDSSLKELKEVQEILSSLCNCKGDFIIKYYNEEESLYANAKMSLTDDQTLTIITKPIDVISILHRYGLSYDANKNMYMLVVPYSCLKERVPEYFKLKGYCSEIFY